MLLCYLQAVEKSGCCSEIKGEEEDVCEGSSDENKVLRRGMQEAGDVAPVLLFRKSCSTPFLAECQGL